jgi:hypothetical protein
MGAGRMTVERARKRAYAADEKADAAGLLLAEALVTGVGDIQQLMVEFRRARADAHYAWCAYSEQLDEARSVSA